MFAREGKGSYIPRESEVELIDSNSVSVADDVNLGGVDEDLSESTDVLLREGKASAAMKTGVIPTETNLNSLVDFLESSGRYKERKGQIATRRV